MIKVSEPVRGIYKLEIPFEDIYTAVFAVKDESGYGLIDCATTDEDVDRHILPTLHRLGCTESPKALWLTHTHGDHAGGAHRLSEHFPDLKIYASAPLKGTEIRLLSDGDTVGERLTVLSLPGHTSTSVGFFDCESGTLISGDCLQLRGVSRYRNGIRDPEAYLSSIERLRTLPIKRILASHEYDPLGSVAEGEDAVKRYLDECERVCWAQHKS